MKTVTDESIDMYKDIKWNTENMIINLNKY